MRLPLARARARLAVVASGADRRAHDSVTPDSTSDSITPDTVKPDSGAILSALPLPCALIDRQNRFRYANPAAEQFFAQSISQLRHLGLDDFVAADSPLFGVVDQVRASEVVVSDHDLNFDSPRLQRRGVTVQGTPLPEDPGCVLLTFQDESAARTLDRQLNFRSAARSVAGMAALLAHEVKNPLSGIRGAAQLLENTADEADRELAVLIRDEADRIRALVERMEAFGEKPIVRDAVNIHRVLEHVKRLAQTGFASHLRIVELYDPSLPPVLGNRDQLVQVMLNLVKNAAEAFGVPADNGGQPQGDHRHAGERLAGQSQAGHTHAGRQQAGQQQAGEITLMTAYQHGVRVAVPGTKRRVHLPLVVTVRDNGTGIPADIRDNLFDPFVTNKPTGSGLGLALVAKIVGEHGGLIEVDSRPGRTDFRLFLPIFLEDRFDASANRW